MSSPPSNPRPKNPHHAGSRLSTIGQGGWRIWQYPVWFRGRLLTARTIVHAILAGILLLGPWIDIGGHPAIRFDIPGRRAYLFGLQFFATDGVYLVLVLGAALFAVFLFTALFGRAWCGWACPQTVFMESIFRPIERLIEGTPAQRRRRDRGPWNLHRIGRKSLTLSIYLFLCGAIGTTAVAYFLGREGIFEAQADPFSHPVGTSIFIFVTALCMFDFAFFREQTCLVACPYGRFQSVLLDQDSIGVGYDFQRGEPRGKVSRRKANPKVKPKADNKTKQQGSPQKLPVLNNKEQVDAVQVGDCVDCHRCMHVCPTGIDIRNGSQMECIQCMACIDVCNDMMKKLDRPPGLIRLDSERSFSGGQRKIMRARVIAYSLGLFAVLIAFSLTLSRHAEVEFNLGRQPGNPYVQLPDGRLQNSYRLRISNKEDDEKAFDIRLDLSPTASESATFYTPIRPLVVPGGSVQHFPVFIMIPPDQAPTSIRLIVTDPARNEHRLEAPFLAPR